MPDLDVKLAAAFRDVPIPPDLAARLLAGLSAAAGNQELSVGQHVTSQPESVERVADAGPAADDRASRRHMLWYTSGLAAAVMIGVGVWSYLPPGERAVDAESLIAAWHPTIVESEWKTSPPPSGFAVPKSISASAQRWQPAASSVGRGVVFDVTRPGAKPAVLFVVHRTVVGVPSIGPPIAPQSTTLGRAGSAWQTGGVLYVLVVDGSAQDYRQYVSAQGLAWQPPRLRTVRLPVLPDRYGPLAAARTVKSS